MKHGHTVSILTSTPFVRDSNLTNSNSSIRATRVITFPSLHTWLRGGESAFLQEMRKFRPEIVLWHIGVTSSLHQRFLIPLESKLVGIFTSPLYRFSELFRMGVFRLMGNPSLSAMHLIGSAIPRSLLRISLVRSGFACLVTETYTTAGRLREEDIWRGVIRIVPPGVDDTWMRRSPEVQTAFRRTLGYKETDVVIGYFGPPALLRGLPVLIDAFTAARETDSRLRLLLILRENDSIGDKVASRYKIRHPGITRFSGILPKAQLAEYINACDLVVFPYLLIPSDAPLGVLEAQALAKPIVATRTGCLPELLSGIRSVLAEPGDVRSLCMAMLQATKWITTPAENPAIRTWTSFGKEWSELIESL
jgi:glycosyltransferase involved in cell wall biosynthesis